MRKELIWTFDKYLKTNYLKNDCHIPINRLYYKRKNDECYMTITEPAKVLHLSVPILYQLTD
jgi:hypothetical protein